MSNDLSGIKNLFADYKTKGKKSGKVGLTKEEILAKYFTPRADKEIFRILPPKPGKQYIETAFFHESEVNDKSGKKRKGVKIYCPAHNDPKTPKLDSDGQPFLTQEGKPVMINVKCPLCEKNEILLAKQDKSLKGIKEDAMNPAQKAIKAENDKIYKESQKWKAKKFHIVKGIDKGAEKDGPKFWRFKDNFKKQGVYDKLIPSLSDFVDQFSIDPTNVNEGTDLSITVVDADFPGGGFTYRSVSAISPRGKSPLHTDSNIIKGWLSDETTWRDVFKKKSARGIEPSKYLELLVEGNDPYWDDTDTDNKRWVFPNNPELEAAANTRDQNLDADSGEKEIEMASDVISDVNISNVTSENVGTYKDESVNVVPSLETQKTVVETPAPAVVETPAPAVVETPAPAQESNDFEVDDIEDLPF